MPVTRRGESGQLLIISAILLPILMGFVGLSIDVGMLLLHRTERQRTADAAALAGAQYLMFNPTDTAGAKNTACSYALKNGYGSGTCNSSEVAVFVPPISGPNTGKDGYVQVKITRTDNTFFIGVLGIGNATVQANAVGGSTPQKRDYALVVLDPHQCDAFTTSSNITINGGGAIVDSDGANGGSCTGESAKQNGASWISAQNCKDKTGATIPCTLDYNAYGSWSYPNNSSTSPTPTKTAPWADPLTCGPPAGNQSSEYCPRPVPCTNASGTSPSPCVPKSPCSGGTVSNPGLGPANSCKSGQNYTLQPGTYYGGISITGTGGGSVTLQPGLYVMAGGGFGCCATSTSISGTGVTIFNTDFPSASRSQDRPCGSLSMTGGTSVNFTAPTVAHTSTLTGYKNMLWWQSETCLNSSYGSASNPDFTYAGSSSGSSWTSTGIIYLPKAALRVTGGGNFGSMQIIVNGFSQGGSQDIVINFTRYIDTDTPRYLLVE